MSQSKKPLKFPDDFINKVTCGDCLEIMKQIPDHSIDLILTDPPYGLDIVGNDKTLGGDGACKPSNFGRCEWDVQKPTKETFKEMFRFSKNQIIFGANHFSNYLPPKTGWVVWDKRKQSKMSNDFSDGELIWTSFDRPLRIFRYLWSGMLQENMKHKEKRYHPTQKPLRLMEYLIENFSKEGDLVFDPFLGSGTTAVACKVLGRNFIGIEINSDYCKIAEKRLAQIPDKRLEVYI